MKVGKFVWDKDFTLGDADIGPLVQKWLPTEKQLRQASATATKKTMQWARALAVREIRADKKIPAAMLRKRINIFRRRGRDGLLRLFFGLSPIPAAWLDPKQNRTGVKLKGGESIAGAFVVDLMGFDAVFKREGKDAYPLEYQYIYYHEQAMRIIRGEIIPQYQTHYLKYLEQELKWRTTR